MPRPDRPGIARHPVDHVADLPDAGFSAGARHAIAAAVHHGEDHARVARGKRPGPFVRPLGIMLVAAETGERIAAAGAAHAVGIRGAPLQAGAHAFAGQVSRATVRRAQAGQHAGQEGAVFLQDFVGRDVGRGQAALGDGELRARKARRHLGHGRIALAAMCDQQVQPRFAQRGDARGASLRIGIGDPFDPQRLAGALGARAPSTAASLKPPRDGQTAPARGGRSQAGSGGAHHGFPGLGLATHEVGEFGGDLSASTKPWPSSFSRKAGSRSTAVNSACSRWRTASGRPAGPDRPMKFSATSPGRPSSPTAGMSGACGTRRSVVTASSRSWPERR